MKKNVEDAVRTYSGENTQGVFVNKLPSNLKKMEQTFDDIKDLFNKAGIPDFSTLPEDEATVGKFVKLYNKFGSVKVLTKSKLIPQELEIASKYAHKATEKQLREIDTNGLLNELIGAIKASTDPLQQICYDVTYLGYTNRTYDAPYYAVTALETNNYGTTYISLYNIQNGSNESYKLSRKWDIECEQGDILEVSFEDKHKHTKDDNGNWVKTDVVEKRIKLFNIILRNPKTK
jgi:hypothetical protein